jgi:hypothetical protein
LLPWWSHHLRVVLVWARNKPRCVPLCACPRAHVLFWCVLNVESSGFCCYVACDPVILYWTEHSHALVFNKLDGPARFAVPACYSLYNMFFLRPINLSLSCLNNKIGV